MTRATRHAQAPLEDGAARFDSPAQAEAAADCAARMARAIRRVSPETQTLVAPEPVAGGKWIARDMRTGATLDRHGRWR